MNPPLQLQYTIAITVVTQLMADNIEHQHQISTSASYPLYFCHEAPPSISYPSSYVITSDSCGTYSSCTEAFNALLEILLSLIFVPNILWFNIKILQL